MVVESILSILDSILNIVEEKVRRKYIDKFYNLQKEWYELNKVPQDERDNARLDAIMFELQLIFRDLASELKPKNPGN